MSRLTELAIAAKAGDDNKLVELLEEWRPAMLAIIRRYTGPLKLPSHAHDDAAQEARIAVCRAVKIFDPARGSFSRLAVWATQDAMQATITKSELIKTVWMRDRGRAIRKATETETGRGNSLLAAVATPLPEEEAYGLKDPSPSPSEIASATERAEAVRKAVLDLPPKARKAVEIYMAGDPVALPGMTRQAAHCQLKTALRKLRSALGFLAQ